MVLTVVACALAAAASPESETYYVDASLDLGGDLLSWRFADVEEDGAQELIVAVRTAAGERELRVHRMGPASIQPEPLHTIPVLEDVLAWSLADVRDEPGQELVFLTRAGVWSYSLTLPGYRDNVRALARLELIYDLPDPRALPYWGYVIPGEGADVLLLPGRDALSLWAATVEGRDYGQRATLETPSFDEQSKSRSEREEEDGPPEFVTGVDEDSTPFLRDDLRAESGLLSDSHGYLAPALIDIDRDGYLDLVYAGDRALSVHMGSSTGPSTEPTRIEALPEELLDTDDSSVELRIVDVDGDDQLDLVAHVQGDIEGFENAPHTLHVYRARDGRWIGERPDQVLRFEAAVLTVEFADVNGDGRTDLALRKLVLPSLVGTVTGIEFTFSYLVYLGERRAFARRPILKQTETYDEESVTALVANRRIALDCDGDGIADLVEVDLEGRIAIRRLRKDSSLLRGETWKVDSAPWKLFDGGGSIESLTVRDLNADGLGDVVSATEGRLVVLLSARRGGK